MGERTTMDKSVLYRERKGSEYDYGEGFRDKNPANLDKNIFKANETSETEEEERKFMGTTAIREQEILITGGEMFTDYISQGITKFPLWIDIGEMAACSWELGFTEG